MIPGTGGINLVCTEKTSRGYSINDIVLLLQSAATTVPFHFRREQTSQEENVRELQPIQAWANKKDGNEWNNKIILNKACHG